MTKVPEILVVGSFVMDMITSTKNFPSEGETVRGCGFSMAPGGKGANQAVQAARLGARVTMVGKVGNDAFGRRLIAASSEAGINIKDVKLDETAPSAVGNVIVEDRDNSAYNRIIVVPGANMTICPKDVSFLRENIGIYDMVILQLEIPMEINILVSGYAKEKGVPVMLNAAPYLEYCVCQYVVFGSCPEDFTHRIGDVTFGRSDCHPNTKIDEEHFVLDFYPIRLPFEESEREDIER